MWDLINIQVSPTELNSVVPEVKIPFIFIIEILIKSLNVVTIQIIRTTHRYIVNQWYLLL